MALEKEIGTATGTLDLMNKFATWVDGLSAWEMTLNQAPGDMAAKLLDRQVSFRRTGDSFYFHWQSNIAAGASRQCPMTCSTGAPVSGESYDAHTGSATAANTFARAGISLPQTSTDVGGNPAATLRYWFHADDNYIVVSVNMDGGWYQHFYAGLVPGFDSDDDCYYLCGSGSGNSNNSSLAFDAANNSFANPFGPLGTATGAPFGIMYHIDRAEFFPAIGGTVPDDIGAHTFDREATYQQRENQIAGPIITTYAANAVVPRMPVTLFFPSPLSGVGAPRHFATGNLEGVWYSPVDVLAEEAAVAVGGDNLLILPAGKSRRIATSYRYVGVSILTTV